MKKTPQMKKLEKMLQASTISAGGFLGQDKRSLFEIIDADAAEIARLGRTKEEIAARMTELSELAEPGLGAWVKAGKHILVSNNDARGKIPCPWAHGIRCSKTLTTVQRLDINETIMWSNLNIHLIKEHGFFEGKGAVFRLEPAKLISIIFPQDI